MDPKERRGDGDTHMTGEDTEPSAAEVASDKAGAAASAAWEEANRAERMYNEASAAAKAAQAEPDRAAAVEMQRLAETAYEDFCVVCSKARDVDAIAVEAMFHWGNDLCRVHNLRPVFDKTGKVVLVPLEELRAAAQTETP